MKNGFTLIEMLVYTGIVGVVGASLTIFLVTSMRAFDKSQALQNVFNNVNDSLKVITDEAKYSTSIYTPTSVLDSDSGQLSLETSMNTPAGENITFIDYYLDNGRVYEKREGSSTMPLTSERVFVDRLRFERKTTAASRDSVTVIIEAHINTTSTAGDEQGRITLTSSASLRGAY